MLMCTTALRVSSYEVGTSISTILQMGKLRQRITFQNSHSWVSGGVGFEPDRPHCAMPHQISRVATKSIINYSSHHKLVASWTAWSGLCGKEQTELIGTTWGLWSQASESQCSCGLPIKNPSDPTFFLCWVITGFTWRSQDCVSCDPGWGLRAPVATGVIYN